MKLLDYILIAAVGCAFMAGYGVRPALDRKLQGPMIVRQPVPVPPWWVPNAGKLLLPPGLFRVFEGVNGSDVYFQYEDVGPDHSKCIGNAAYSCTQPPWWTNVPVREPSITHNQQQAIQDAIAFGEGKY